MFRRNRFRNNRFGRGSYSNNGFGNNSYGNNRFNGGYGNNRFGNRFGGGGYGGYNNGGFWGAVAIVIIVILGIVFLQHQGTLGHYKNRLFATPQEQRARMNKGITEAQQANKNVDNEELVKRGDKSAANKIIHDPVLLKDQFSFLPDMFNMGGKVYSVYVFANSKDYDAKWEPAIKAARNKTMKVYTLNGREVDNTDDTFVYHYFNYNYAVSKNNKEYGKLDGVPHPFMVLIVNGVPQKLITRPSEQKAFFDYQLKLQEKYDSKANNYKIPDQPVGLKYPRWGKYAKYVKNKAQQTYNDVKNHNDTVKNNQNSNNQNNNSQQNNGQGKSLSEEILGH